ncbi:hypothetical protein MRBBS_1873 [Marinobacter sp. BSs20148]|nr:hypothetical protein MRBBS_1873 [Marinobacter sp. BSs20148]
MQISPSSLINRRTLNRPFQPLTTSFQFLNSPLLQGQSFEFGGKGVFADI